MEIQELKELIADKESWQLYAKLTKTWFDALVEEGFTPEQAIKIVCENPTLIKE